MDGDVLREPVLAILMGPADGRNPFPGGVKGFRPDSLPLRRWILPSEHRGFSQISGFGGSRLSLRWPGICFELPFSLKEDHNGTLKQEPPVGNIPGVFGAKHFCGSERAEQPLPAAVQSLANQRFALYNRIGLRP